MNYLFRSNRKKINSSLKIIQGIKIFTENYSSLIYKFPKYFSSDINPFSSNEKSKSKFTKVSPQTTSNIPLEEENIFNLLSEMKTIQSKDNRNHLVQKNEILFIANPDESMEKVKLGQFIRINNKMNAQCFSIKDNLYTFLCLNKQK